MNPLARTSIENAPKKLIAPQIEDVGAGLVLRRRSARTQVAKVNEASARAEFATFFDQIKAWSFDVVTETRDRKIASAKGISQ